MTKNNRLFDLPPELLSIIYTFEGGDYYKLIFSYVVLPSMIKSLWNKWKTNYIKTYTQKYNFYKKRIFPIDYLKTPANFHIGYNSPIIHKPISKKFNYEYYFKYITKKMQFLRQMTVLDFLEKNYWNRMLTCPIDSLNILVHYMYSPEFEFEENTFNEFYIFWEKCKAFPSSVFIEGIIVDSIIFDAFYKCVKYENAPQSQSILYYNVEDTTLTQAYRILFYSKKYKSYILEYTTSIVDIDDDDESIF